MQDKWYVGKDGTKWRVDKDGVHHNDAMRERDAAEDFICQRVAGVSEAGFEDACRRAVVELFRSDMPLDSSPMWRHYAADELEMFWFMTPQERRLARGRQRRKGRAHALKSLISWVARKERVSKEKAIGRLEEDGALGLTVEAIKQSLKPSRIAGNKK